MHTSSLSHLHLSKNIAQISSHSFLAFLFFLIGLFSLHSVCVSHVTTTYTCSHKKNILLNHFSLWGCRYLAAQTFHHVQYKVKYFMYVDMPHKTLTSDDLKVSRTKLSTLTPIFSGRFLGILVVCKSNRLHGDILRSSFTKLGYIL